MATQQMNATSATDRAVSAERIDFIKCETAWCRHNLGVRLAGGRVYWHVPVVVDFITGESTITCPCCEGQRVWRHHRPKRR